MKPTTIIVSPTVEQLAEEYIKNDPDYNVEGLSDYQNGKFNGFIDGYNTRNADIESIIKEVLKRATQMGRGYSLNEDNFQHKIKQSILNTPYSDLL